MNELQTPESISEPQEATNYLNTHFTEIGSKLASEIPSVANTGSPENFLDRASNSTFEITKLKSSKLLKKANISKATGHDKISNKILKIHVGAPFMYKSLTDLFNLSITTKVFPV